MAESLKIDWENYNFPPYLHLVHYDPTELKDEKRAAVRWVERSYALVLVTLCVNFISMIIVAAGGVAQSGTWVAFSIFNIVLYIVFGFYSFYTAYKGIATSNAKLTYRYMGMQGVFLIIYLIFALANGANIEGFTNIARAQAMGLGISGAWVAFSVIESILWLANIGVGGYAWWLVYQMKGSMLTAVARAAV